MQITALKAAYATLSDVLVEETESFHNQAAALRDSVHSCGKEIEVLQDGEQSLARAQRSLESNLADVRREAGRVEHRAADAESIARVTEASTRDAIVMMQQQVAALAARCSAAEDRAAAAEDRAAAAESAAQVAAEASDAARIAATTLSGKLEQAFRDNDRHVRDLERRVHSVTDQVREVQQQLSVSITSGLASVTATVERVNKEMGTHISHAANTDRALSSLRQATADADAALAKDVAMLADSIASLRQGVQGEVAALTSRIASVSASGEDGRRGEAEERERRLASLSKAVDVELDEMRRTLQAAEAHSTHVKRQVEDHHRATGTDLKSSTNQLASLEAYVTAQATEQSRRLDETNKSVSGRLDAMSSALHAFANVLNLGQIVIDPKAVLSRSLTAAGIPSPSPTRSGTTAGLSSSIRHATGSAMSMPMPASPVRTSGFAPSPGVAGSSNHILQSAMGGLQASRGGGYGVGAPSYKTS